MSCGFPLSPALSRASTLNGNGFLLHRQMNALKKLNTRSGGFSSSHVTHFRVYTTSYAPTAPFRQIECHLGQWRVCQRSGFCELFTELGV
jgi:hypothetical protein